MPQLRYVDEWIYRLSVVRGNTQGGKEITQVDWKGGIAMKSNLRKKKPDREARDKINARARKALINAGVTSLGELSEMQKMSPSQRKSILGRKRLSRRG